MPSRRTVSRAALLTAFGSAGCTGAFQNESEAPKVTLCDLLLVNYSPNPEEVIVEVKDLDGTVHEFAGTVNGESTDENWISFDGWTPLTARGIQVRAKRQSGQWEQIALETVENKSIAVIVKVSRQRHVSIFHSGNCEED